MDSFALTPELVVGLAFILFMAIFFAPIYKLITKAADARAESIAATLQEAKRLHEEAVALRDTYLKKQQEIELEAEEILAKARADASQLREEAAVQLQKAIHTRTTLTTNRIAQEETQLLQHMREEIIRLSFDAAKDVLAADKTVKSVLPDAHAVAALAQ